PFVQKYLKYRCEISNGPISFHFIAPNFFLIGINHCSKNNYWHNYFFKLVYPKGDFLNRAYLQQAG
ncbi:MAG: hypothetical protein ACK5QC_06095, partial [Bacteroidota bacterium]